MRNIIKMNCNCGSDDVAFTICESDSKGTSDFCKDLISRYGNPFGVSKGKQIDLKDIKEYLLNVYVNGGSDTLMGSAASGTCYGSCEDQTECSILFDDGTRFEFENDSDPSMYTFDENLTSEEKALLYLCEITNADIERIRNER